jgi:hypothetical protein
MSKSRRLGTASAARLKVLADVLPVLEAAEVDFGHWELPPPKNGVHSLGWFELGPAGEAFLAAVAKGRWVTVGFDWRTWLESGDGRRFRDQQVVDAADADDLARLITAIVRSDRFVEGSLAGAFESGLLTRIARRANVLVAEAHGRAEPNAGKTPPG